MAKKNKRNDGYLSIRKKLIAAVAMLLVASFMVASSSYAWFTLSTAPEITGIQTAVGANGNLEMALYAGADPTSAVGDGATGKNIIEKNLTWGNLVDLSDSAYGLQLISLLPARLNVASVTDGKATITTGAPLMTPKYAADGRIEKLEGGTAVGAYKAADSSFATGNDKTGVYAIGNSNNETAQQRDYRNSLAQIGTYISTARSSAIKSLSKVGNDLGSYAAQHASKSDAVDNGPYDLTNTLDMITNMKTASTALDNIMISLAKFAYAAKTEGDNYTTWAPSEGATDAAGEAFTYLSSISGHPNFVAAVTTINTKRVDVKTAVTEAEAAYTAAQARITAATWEDLKAICGPLVNVDSILINGKPISELNTDAGRQELVNAAFGGGLYVQMPIGSGAYADIAQIVDNYTVGITLTGISYNGINAPDIPAKMQTTVGTGDVVDVIKIDDIPTNPTGTASNPTITDMYGYKIDMAFRTNASESKLMLQTEAAGRIYSSGASEQTMGKGSTMTFATEAAGFTVEQMISLMGSVRIIFADTNTGEVVALAGLDTANVEATDGGALNAPVRILDSTKYSIDDKGIITFTLVDGKKVFVDGDKAAIMALDANAVETLSVYVYLDGDSVENKDVAATTSESMAGTLNLQFSSSAALVPMNYAPLKSDTTVTPPTNP